MALTTGGLCDGSNHRRIAVDQAARQAAEVKRRAAARDAAAGQAVEGGGHALARAVAAATEAAEAELEEADEAEEAHEWAAATAAAVAAEAWAVAFFARPTAGALARLMPDRPAALEGVLRAWRAVVPEGCAGRDGRPTAAAGGESARPCAPLGVRRPAIGHESSLSVPFFCHENCLPVQHTGPVLSVFVVPAAVVCCALAPPSQCLCRLCPLRLPPSPAVPGLKEI